MLSSAQGPASAARYGIYQMRQTQWFFGSVPFCELPCDILVSALTPGLALGEYCERLGKGPMNYTIEMQSNLRRWTVQPLLILPFT